MELQTLKSLGEIAGIIGIGLGILFLLYRSLIGKFPRFEKTNAYKLSILIIGVTATLALLMVGTWSCERLRAKNNEQVPSQVENPIKDSTSLSQDAYQENERNISGKVYDDVTDKEIKGAKVEIIELINIFTYSDSQGTFVIKGVRGKGKHSYTIKVSHTNYSSTTRVVEIDFSTKENLYIDPEFKLKKK